MTVAELREKLAAAPADAKVLIAGEWDDGYGRPDTIYFAPIRTAEYSGGREGTVVEIEVERE